jgi:hypothetical protein
MTEQMRQDLFHEWEENFHAHATSGRTVIKLGPSIFFGS